MVVGFSSSSTKHKVLRLLLIYFQGCVKVPIEADLESETSEEPLVLVGPVSAKEERWVRVVSVIVDGEKRRG